MKTFRNQQSRAIEKASTKPELVTVPYGRSYHGEAVVFLDHSLTSPLGAYPVLMKTVIKVSFLLFLLPFSTSAQSEANWPSLSYLRNDYRSVSVVTHVLIREAEITGRIGGYENWRVVSEVVETFKGKVRKGDVIEYFQGVEAGLKKEYFQGEKIIFLLADHDEDKNTLRYSVLENSTLPHTADVVRKLRIIKRSYAKKRSRR